MRLRIAFSLAWLLLTFSLGLWWLVHGLGQANRVADLQAQIESLNPTSEIYSTSIPTWEKESRMILYEGVFFLTLLLIGGLLLIWLSFLDFKRDKLLQDFFSTLTHEIKTPLASLRLQIETLAEELPKKTQKAKTSKLLKENVRIESQIDKAFYLASLMKSEKLFLEDKDIESFVWKLEQDWENLEFNFPKNTWIRVDQKAMEAIFRNLIENSFVHGYATQIRIEAIVKKQPTPTKTGVLELSLLDNGRGYSGNISSLGKPFLRLASTSGSGIGLYIVRKLLQKQKSKMEYLSPKESIYGFGVRLFLPLVLPPQNLGQNVR